MEIRKDYRDEKILRDSFNALAEETFGLNFENWYQMGYWKDNYNPYSVVVDGKVVANVSVNRTDMLINGERKHLYQLGTVMTAQEYRNQGLIRAIMAEVEKDLADADGIYLFANDGVVDFYPKFGFVPGKEYLYSKAVSQTGENHMVQVKMDTQKNRENLAGAMEKNGFRAGCTMVENPGLIFFYAAQFMQDCVYYCKKLDCWVIAELEDGELMLHNVFAASDISLDAVIGAFGAEVNHVTLGFVPADTTGFTVEEYQEEDSHFFVKGNVFGEAKLRIPTLSHA